MLYGFFHDDPPNSLVGRWLSGQMEATSSNRWIDRLRSFDSISGIFSFSSTLEKIREDSRKFENQIPIDIRNVSIEGKGFLNGVKLNADRISSFFIWKYFAMLCET